MASSASRSLIKHSVARSYLTPQVSMKASNASSASFLVSAIQISCSARFAWRSCAPRSVDRDAGVLDLRVFANQHKRAEVVGTATLRMADVSEVVRLRSEEHTSALHS